MSTFLYGIGLQWKLDFRNKGVVVTYYVVPLVFFAFMGGIFTSINPDAKDTLIQSMTVFAVTMGTILGSPAPLVELYGSDIKKAYKVGGIPLWVGAVNNAISAFIHLMITSAIIYVAAPLIYQATAPESVTQHFLSVALFLLAAIGVGTLLGLFVKATSKLTMLAQIIFLPSVMLSGIMFPLSYLPSVLATIGKLFPATWGFILLTEKFDWANVFPLVIIFAIATVLSAFKLSRIKRV